MDEQEHYQIEAQAATHDRNGLSVHAGFPNPSADAKPLSLDFNQLLIRHATSTFVFRVRGHSWAQYGVFDNDLAVVDRLLNSTPTDIVVWCRYGEAGFMIAPISAALTDATAWGVITAIIHEYRKRPHE